jgi:hypothetical protein
MCVIVPAIKCGPGADNNSMRVKRRLAAWDDGDLAGIATRIG